MSPTSILVVDDDPKILESLSTGLRSSGYQVATATDGPQAITAARRTPPDLIVLEVIPSGGTGFDVLKRLRGIASTSAIPVIAMTADLAPTLPKQARDLGASAFMLKPVKSEDLVRTIQRILGESEAPAAVGSQRVPLANPLLEDVAPAPGRPSAEVQRNSEAYSVPSAAKIWEQFQDLLFDRLASVEAGVAALFRGALTPDLRQKAILESHRLAGSLGLLGLAEGTHVAREIEQLLAGEVPFGADPNRQMAGLAGRLRQVLEKGIE